MNDFLRLHDEAAARTRLRYLIALAVLVMASAAFAVDDKPAGPVLDSAWEHYDKITNAVVFTNGSGTTATSLIGHDWDVIAGTEDTNFRWVNSNGLGGAFSYLDTTANGGLKGPVESGNEVRAAGTIVFIAKFPSGTGRVWNTGSALTAANGMALATMAAVAQMQVRVGGANTNLTPLFNGEATSYVADTWYPCVFTWTTTTAQFWIQHGDGKAWDGEPAISWPGVTILDTTREGLLGTATAGAASSIAGFLLLDEAIDSNGVEALLADPWVWLEPGAQDKFLLPTPITSRQTPTGASIFRTVKADADPISWRVRYGAASGWAGNSTTSATSTSTGDDTEERLQISLTGLTANTKYQYAIDTDTNGSGMVEVMTNGFFWTGTDSNTATVRGVVMSDCHSKQSVGVDAGLFGFDAAAVVDVVEYWDAQALIHLGDLTSVAKTGIENRAQVFDFYADYSGWWTDLWKISALYYVPGNHDLVGCEYYGLGNASSLDSNGWFQQWGTEAWKSCFGNPAETWTAPITEWALTADIGEAWLTGANAQPFETAGRFRHGPVEFFFVDSERFGDVTEGENCQDAEHATLGATQWAELQANITSSTATFKIPVFHRPPGGYDVDGAADAQEIYRRGSPATSGLLRTDYEWAAQWAWFETTGAAQGVVAIISGHDHVASVVRLDRSPHLVSIVAGSPVLPFTHGYDAGYNAGATDPPLGPFDAGTPVAGVDALFWSGDRGVWLYEASGSGTATTADDVLTLRWVRTSNDARDGTLNEVGYTYTIPAGGGGSGSSGSGNGGNRTMGIGL